MVIGYITLALGEKINAKAARHIVDEIASYAIQLHAIDAVKCDIAELDGTCEAEFWTEAHE